MTSLYGQELVVDLVGCNPDLFTRSSLQSFLIGLCDVVLEVERHDLHFWDYEGDPEEKADAPSHLKGTTAIQFLTTSNVLIHTLDDLQRVFLNIFVCGKIRDPEGTIKYCRNFFEGTVEDYLQLTRGGIGSYSDGVRP